MKLLHKLFGRQTRNRRILLKRRQARRLNTTLFWEHQIKSLGRFADQTGK